MSRRLLIAVMLVFIAIATTIMLGLMSFGSVLAADDTVTIKLRPWLEGDVTVVDVSVTNNSKDNLGLEIQATLPTGATYVGANPQGSSKFAGNTVTWEASASAGRTLVGLQYKFKGGSGTTSASVLYIGSTRGTVVASTDIGGVAAEAAKSALQIPAKKAPEGVLKVMAIPANAAVSTIKAQLPSTGATIAFGTTGLSNVSVGVPVQLQAGSVDPSGAPAKTFAWTLTVPTASKAKLDKNNEAQAKFTPDVPGIYKVDVVVSNEAGRSTTKSVQVRAGTYIGLQQGGCAACHPSEATEWAKTNHATIMKREIDGGADAANSHYGEGCLRCHTTGYYIGAANGGFAEVQAKTGWKFPALTSIQTGKGNWDAVPAELKNMGNIQCEACHGPAKEHVTAKASMAASTDPGVCNVCHNGGGHHAKGAMLANAKHGEEESRAWTYPVGPDRQACVRCHSQEGYISFTKNPTEMSAWNNNAEALGCAGCHDPHSEENKFQLRIAGKPVEAVGISKDYGLSATCVECHNGRVVAADAQKGSYPHYSTAAEMLANMGGVTYGQKVSDSPHGVLVGTSPIKNPADATGATTLFGGVAPGACVACHMWPTIWDTKDPNYLKVGDHSFNMSTPDGTYDYTASCQTCHPGLKKYADFKSRADYDGNGKIESVQAEVAGLLTKLQTAIGDSGIKPVQGNPYFDRDALAKANEKQKNAVFNYRFVRGLEGSDGKANAIHNFKRSVILLQLSYKDLTGKDVPGATIMQ